MRPEVEVVRVAVPGETLPPGATWSNCLKIGDAVHVSGVTARDGDGAPIGGDDVEAQTLACFEVLRRRLEAAGGGLHCVYKLVIHLTDMSGKAGVNAARAAVFGPVAPCSTLVGASSLAGPGLLVEVDAFADLRVDLRRAIDRLP